MNPEETAEAMTIWPRLHDDFTELVLLAALRFPGPSYPRVAAVGLTRDERRWLKCLSNYIVCVEGHKTLLWADEAWLTRMEKRNLSGLTMESMVAWLRAVDVLVVDCAVFLRHRHPVVSTLREECLHRMKIGRQLIMLSPPPFDFWIWLSFTKTDLLAWPMLVVGRDLDNKAAKMVGTAQRQLTSGEDLIERHGTKNFLRSLLVKPICWV